MNGQTPQPPQTWWEATLDLFRWACRIPAACFVVFTGCCLAFLGLMFVLRLTAWVFRHWLAHWW